VQLAQTSFAVVVVSLLVLGATLAEREAATGALALAASRLREAQALAHLGSWEWDIRRDLVRWSDELYRVFGLDRERAGPLSYSTYLELVHPDDRELADRAVKSALEDGQPYALEHRIVRPDGLERIVASRGRVVLRGEEPVKMLGTGQDVTEQRRVEKLREDILSAVSHELRTPLTSVLGFALTLEKHRKSLTQETIDETVSALARAARRLDRWLADLLDVERLRRGVVALQRERVDVDELVQRAVEECARTGRALRVDCEPVCHRGRPGQARAHRREPDVNAGKHAPNAGSIEVRLTRRGRDMLLVVEDDGPGIPDEFKEVVFETFNRGPSMLATTPGAGIGLSLVAQFTAVHGGRSWVEDRPGGGASFHVLFPDCVRGVRQPAVVPLVGLRAPSSSGTVLISTVPDYLGGKTMETRTVTAVLRAPKDDVFNYLSQIENLPGWATEFARELKYEDGKAKVVNGRGEFFFAIEAEPKTGVIDMYAGPTEDELALFPTRVVGLPNGASAFSFTMFQVPGVPDDVFESQYRSLLRELQNIRRMFA
jgi:PAS domain S-box-containing protein